MSDTNHPMSQARELALQALFQSEFSRDNSTQQTVSYLAKASKLGPEPQKVAETLLNGTDENREKLDSMISDVAQHWSLERMALVDVSLLRLACFEMLFLKEAPPKVVINEYIELAKKYGTQESAAFVNGLLDKIKSNHIE